MVNQLDCISNIYCYKSKSNKNTKLIVNIIYYTNNTNNNTIMMLFYFVMSFIYYL